jgi:hypothetical protein
MRILCEARALGIAVGSNGVDVVVHTPRQVPTETREWFYRQLYEFREEVIGHIQRGPSNIPRRWLETRKTRDAVVPTSDADREMRDGWCCIPVPPTNDAAWFIVDSSHDWKTTWGRWRDAESVS